MFPEAAAKHLNPLTPSAKFPGNPKEQPVLERVGRFDGLSTADDIRAALERLDAPEPSPAA